jgi:hypothetical protein
MRTLALRWIVVAAATLALSAVGCKKDGDGGGSGKPAGPSKAEQMKAFQENVLPEVQAAVPADAPKVEFEAKLAEKEKLIAAVPKGWKEGVIPGSYQPPDEASLGFMTRYTAGTNCDGSCEPKDWKATADKVNFAQFQGDQFQVQKDDALTEPAGRILVANTKDDGKVYIAAARWQDGASFYITCSVTLDKEAAALAPAFEKACRANVGLF